MRKIVLTGLTTLTLVAGTTLAALPAHAVSTLVVAIDGKATATNCNATTVTPYKTISAAVTAAASGDTVKVCPGTYSEHITTAKFLIILGAEAGIDARTRATSSESIVDGGGGTAFAVSGTNTIINGFTLKGATNGGQSPALEFDGAEEVSSDNIFTGDNVALLLNGSGATFQQNKVTAPASGGYGVLSQGNATGATKGNGSGSSIDENAFNGNLTGGAIEVSDSGNPLGQLVVSSNTVKLTGAGSFAFLAGTQGVTIEQNTVTGTTTSGPGIDLVGGNSSYTITQNSIQGLGAPAIQFDAAPSYPANGGGTIDSNALLHNTGGIVVLGLASGQTIVANLNILVHNDTGTPGRALYNTSAGALSAFNNFFGCNTGPDTTGCDATFLNASSGGSLVDSVWMVLSTAVTQSSIAVGGTTTFTAQIINDSVGATPTGHVLDGAETATFTFNHGTVTPATAKIVNGIATTTIKGTSAGAATATATVEAATSSQPITVTGATLPAASIADATTAEGNSGTHTLAFKVTLSKAATAKVTLHFATANGTATAGSDYVAKSGTLTIAKGKTTGTVTVVIKGDKVKEPTETFTLTLTAPVNATIADGSATGTITNDD